MDLDTHLCTHICQQSHRKSELGLEPGNCDTQSRFMIFTATDTEAKGLEGAKQGLDSYMDNENSQHYKLDKTYTRATDPPASGHKPTTS